MEAMGETVLPVKLEVKGPGRRALSEKKREHDREAVRERAATDRVVARERVSSAMRAGGGGSGEVEERTWFHVWRERVEASRLVRPILWNGVVLHLVAYPFSRAARFSLVLNQTHKK
jgi:hypothetical protein